MNHVVRPWRRRVAQALVLALVLATAPVCLAGEPPGSPQSSHPKLAASVEKAVQQELGQIAKASDSGAAVARQSTASAPGTHSGFFKSRTGMITIALLAAGTGFALYSTQHDRVKSPQVPYGGTWK